MFIWVLLLDFAWDLSICCFKLTPEGVSQRASKRHYGVKMKISEQIEQIIMARHKHLQSVDTSASRAIMADARRELEECLHRFGRKSISISVIGEARRGKSALLKSISGLNDLVILAFESTDCTGTPSVMQLNFTFRGMICQ